MKRDPTQGPSTILHTPDMRAASKVSQDINFPLNNKTMDAPVLMQRVTDAEEKTINELL